MFKIKKYVSLTTGKTVCVCAKNERKSELCFPSLPIARLLIDNAIQKKTEVAHRQTSEYSPCISQSLEMVGNLITGDLRHKSINQFTIYIVNVAGNH